MTDPNRPFHNPDLRTAVDAPVQAGETSTTPSSAEVAAHAEAQATQAATDTLGYDTTTDVVTPNRRRGGKALALGIAIPTAIGAGGVAAEVTNVVDVIPNWPAQSAPLTPGTPENGGTGGETGGENTVESNNVTPEYEITPETMAIPSGLTPEQFGEEFLKRMEMWAMGGATPEGAAAQFEELKQNQTTISEYAQRVAEENAAIASLALFGENPSPEVQDEIADMTVRNAQNLANWLATYHEGDLADSGYPEDVEAYNNGYEFGNSFGTIEVTNEDGSTTSYKIYGTEEANPENNRVGSLYPETLGIDGTQFYWDITSTLDPSGTKSIIIDAEIEKAQ